MDEEEVVWMKPDTSQCSIVSYDTKGQFTLHESKSESEKDKRKILKDQRIRDNYQRTFSLSLSLLLSVNGP